MKKQQSEIMKFVKSLFESMRKENTDGILIMLDDNKICIVKLEENNDEVTVLMNDTIMGVFKELKNTPQGYKYQFKQKNRKGIKEKPTKHESFMCTICDNILIKFIGERV